MKFLLKDFKNNTNLLRLSSKNLIDVILNNELKKNTTFFKFSMQYRNNFITIMSYIIRAKLFTEFFVELILIKG